MNHNEKNEKEEKNWISKDEIDNIKNNLLQSVLNNKNKQLDKDKYNNLLSLMVLSLYTDLPPRRNADYQYMIISGDDDGNTNLLDLKNSKFIFNKYKTARSAGKQELNFKDNDKFKNVLSLYLKHHPLKKMIMKKEDVPFLVFQNGEVLLQTNSITRILNKLFKKNVSSSLLRKFYLSNKYGDELNTLKEMKKDAQAMGHSSGTQQNIYIKEQP